MGRRLLAFGLAVAMQAGALSAPLVHAHVGEDDDDHHASGRIHAHVDGHAAAPHDHGKDPAVRAAENPDRIVPVKLFVAAHAAAGFDPAVAPAQFAAVPPAGSMTRQPPQVVRSHSPPALTATTPRAPPDLLS